MIIYVLKHQNPKFSGIFFGVGFDKGRGSTCSRPDRDRCVRNGCKDITSKIESIKAAQKKKEEAVAAKAKEKAKKEADKKAAKAEKDKAKEPEKEEEEEKIEEPEKEEK